MWALFFWRVLTPNAADQLTFEPGDFTLQFLAYRQMAFRQFAQGILPVLEECLYSGHPFQADPQSQVLYPPVLALMLLGQVLGWANYPLRALEWEVMVHVLWLSLGLYVFLRRGLRLSRRASVFGAIAGTYNGFITSYPLLQTGILQTYAWLPWQLLCFLQLARTASTPKAWVTPAIVLAALLACAFAAGHPQTLLFGLYCGIAVFLMGAWQDKVPPKTLLRLGLIVAVFSLGLAAAQLVPQLRFTQLSTRASINFNEASNGFQPRDIAMLAFAEMPWQPLYAGLATLVLAAVALVRVRTHTAWLWLGVAVCGLVLSFGGNVLGFDLAYLIAPGYGQFRSQERHASLFVLALAVLGALGFHWLIHTQTDTAKTWTRQAGRVLWLCAAFAFGLLYLAKILDAIPGAPPTYGTLLNRLTLAALVLMGMAALFSTSAPQHWARVAGIGCIGLLVFELFSNNRYTALRPPSEPFPKLALLESIQTSSLTRIHNHHGLPLNGACVRGYAEIGGGSPIVVRSYHTFLNRAAEDIAAKLLNVRHTVTWRGGMGLDNGRQIPARKIATAKVGNSNDAINTFALDWQPADAKPAWIVPAPNVLAVENEDALYSRLNAAGFDPFTQAIVYTYANTRDPAPSLATPAQTQAQTPAQPQVGIEGTATGYMKIATFSTTPGLLVISKAHYPNWVALVNGVETQPIITNGALLGVPVPAGNSSVELSYRPIDLWVGIGIGAMALLAMSVLWLWSRTPSKS
jgi:hypothetical protein